jgi:SAM-dependent methyltransferase
MIDAMRLGGQSTDCEALFRQHLRELPAHAQVLELGTMRWEADRPTHHAEWLPRDVEHVRSDFLDGPDVDVVADAHELTETFGFAQFDAAIAVSVWEHLRLPWIAARQLRQVLKPGGMALVVTHHTFPRHGYPDDYTRWDVEGIKAMFEWANFDEVDGEHAFPCTITPPPEVTRWNTAAPAWLNVAVVARVKP